MKNFLRVVLLLALAGCATATTANYERVLNSWVGFKEIDLVRDWGPPNRAYELSGRRFFEYTEQRIVHVPSVPPTYQRTVIGNTVYATPVGVGQPGYTAIRGCTTTFELEDDTIVAWHSRGDSCVRE